MEERAFALGVQFVLLRVFGESSKLPYSNDNEQMASADVILS